jgi:hypothetical protein
MSDDRVPERYSRITRRMWCDDRFRALSRPTANAQDLWIYLLTGSHCGRIPGLFVLGPLQLAERLRWPVEETRRCFQEILDQGLAQWDPETLLCWLPNAVRHNEPANPNVVLGWAEEWRAMPECRLLGKARRGIRRQLADVSEAFAVAFDKLAGKPPRKASGKPLAKGSAKPSGKQDPDQDPDQEQEQKIPPSPVNPAPATPRARACAGEPESGGERSKGFPRSAGEQSRKPSRKRVVEAEHAKPSEHAASAPSGNPSPERPTPGADDVEPFLAAFDQRWATANGGRARAEGPRDRMNAARIVRAAHEQAWRAGEGVTPLQVLDHWTARLVRDLEREPIMDPLACLLSRIGGYGLPLPQSQRPPSAQLELPVGQVATPEEVAAILKCNGLAKTTPRTEGRERDSA